MSINTNVLSLTTQRNLGANQSSLGTSMQRLSSGLRVNSAKDDAAGLAIAERMQSQVRGMSVALRNANDAVSLTQTGEGALSKIGDALQRMRELAVQSRNATNNDDDRASSFAPLPRLATTTPTFSGQNTTQPSTPSPVSPLWLYTNARTRPPRRRHLPEHPPSDHDHRRPPTSTATVPFAPEEPLARPMRTTPTRTLPR
jgi:hypothetical protein